MRRAALLIPLLALSGCLWVPTGWRLGGKATDNAEKKEEKRDAAKDALVSKARETAHKVDETLAQPASERRDEVARGFSSETVTALDQAIGAPDVGESAKWKKLVQDLLSENTEVRKKAEAQRAKDSTELAKLSSRLTDAEQALDRAEKRVREYAEENARVADMFRKAIWAMVGLGFLAIVGFGFSIYVKFALGGFPSAVSAALSRLDTTHPDAAKVARGVVNEVLDRREKRRLSTN